MADPARPSLARRLLRLGRRVLGVRSPSEEARAAGEALGSDLRSARGEFSFFSEDHPPDAETAFGVWTDEVEGVFVAHAKSDRAVEVERWGANGRYPGWDGRAPIGIVERFNDDGTVTVRVVRWSFVFEWCQISRPRRGPYLCRLHTACREQPELAVECWEEQRQRTPEQRYEAHRRRRENRHRGS